MSHRLLRMGRELPWTPAEGLAASKGSMPSALGLGTVPQAEQARAAALKLGLIGMPISLTRVLRPCGLLGEEVVVSRER
jgi:hypothetical protein